MAKIGLQKGSGKRLQVREKSVKSQGILKWILSGNPDLCVVNYYVCISVNDHTCIYPFLLPMPYLGTLNTDDLTF